MNKDFFKYPPLPKGADPLAPPAPLGGSAIGKVVTTFPPWLENEKGKILRFTPEKIMWRWSGKKWVRIE